MTQRPYVVDEMISAKAIAARIEALSHEIEAVFADTEKLVVVGLLRGSFVFIADLVRELNLPVEVDFIEAFAGPLPLRVLCKLFDIPESLDETIARWSASLIRIGDILMTPEQKVEALEALGEFKAFLREQISARQNRDEDNLMGLAIQAYKDGTLDEEETLTNLVSMLVAGHETTVTLIGNGMLLLMRNPQELARLRKDPDLMRTAIEEFLRMEPGGNMILRVAREDVEVEGTLIPKGAPVIGLIGAINRDPARFERPDELDIGRPANAQFTFGGGAHVLDLATGETVDWIYTDGWLSTVLDGGDPYA